KGTDWVRVGPRRARANEADERVLSERRAAYARKWDARPCMQAELADLALGLFEAYKLEAVAKDVLDDNHRSITDQLASLRFLDRHSGRPTHAAILLFAKDVLEFVPGAYVQYVRYAGPDMSSDVERERRFTGDLLAMLRD